MKEVFKVAVVGGGVSGAVIALQLAENGIDSVLFEKRKSIVNGPPFCHLHAGGNLYPDISDEQCRILMQQSINMARIFPQSIDKRPTFISIPKTEKYEVRQITNRLDMLVDYYKSLINEDAENEILGTPENYYKVYDEEDLSILAKNTAIENPKTLDEWATNAIKLIDLSKLKMPIIMVNEYGWNLFRLGAQAQIALEENPYSDLRLNTVVTDIKDVRQKNMAHNWEIYANGKVFKAEYLVNACGFRTGDIDEILNFNTERLIEFKAAYISKWKTPKGLIPELIFHGERGTPHGMAQLTPYCDNYYQIHGMTEDITLFKNGLVKAEANKVQPEFEKDITTKLEKGWDKFDTEERTQNAIQFVANFVPSFKSATVGGPPLFGAQQIPGNDLTLRVGEVSFPTDFYARSEIVKASSALTVAKQIRAKMLELGIVSENEHKNISNEIVARVSKKDIDKLASELAKMRNYPEALGRLVVEK